MGLTFASKPECRKALRLLIFAALTASCGRDGAGTPTVVVEGRAIYIRPVPGIPAGLPDVRVHVGERATADPPVAGRTAIVSRHVVFTPMFPLEAGRSYFVRVDWRVAGLDHDPTEAVVRIPANAPAAPVRVTGIRPALDDVPENLLRLYIHFSGPMGRGAGPNHVRLLDARGTEVVDPFLPVDGEFWNSDRTRYTLFFDPGRVKTGILPNERMGRPLKRGERYTLVVDRDWTDASGRPLSEEYRHTFTPGRAIVAPLAPDAWPLALPRAGTREPLVVSFPHALDYGLLQRALGIEEAGRAVDGTPDVPESAREWRFTPASPWTASAHQLVVLTVLEDPSGNRIGRAFEVEGATRGPAGPDRVRIAWSPRR